MIVMQRRINNDFQAGHTIFSLEISLGSRDVVMDFRQIRRITAGLVVIVLGGLLLVQRGGCQAKGVPAANSATSVQRSNTAENRAAKAPYLIGPGDLLAVSVWKNSDLSRTMPVRPDGRISLPLIGEIQAAGLSAVQLQEVIAHKLDSYVSRPEVSVVVQEIKSRSFNIVGRVMKAGKYDLTAPVTVLDAIALAGGFQDFAHVKKIYVLRPTPGGLPAMLPFNYKEVIKGENPAQNITLQPGDTVVVP
jgi:polysaccharide export outer membrane protein